MNIGELASLTGASIRSLRYYEAKKLLSSQRGENGYRFYESTAIEQVKTIQFYLRLGLSTKEIFDIVGCCEPDEISFLFEETDLASCPEELALYQARLAEIEEQIASLEQARTYLKKRLARISTPEKHEWILSNEEGERKKGKRSYL